jgi:hypothetical protein
VLLVLLSLLIGPQFSNSSTPAVITGRVVAGAPPAPVAAVSVRAELTVAVTDADGRFALTIPSTASAHLMISAAGYIEQQVDVSVTDGRGDVQVVLIRAPEYREEVVVSGRASDVVVAPPTLVVEPLTVNRVAGSLDNVFRVLQTMPGVTATEDFGSRLTVRGGGPDENLTVMDGVEIHNPYRLFGLTSAFNPETIDRFELTAGGFGAQYGDRLSSILLVDNRAGTRSRPIAGSAALSATDGNVVLEGGLPSGSWLVTGRRTYYDLVADRITGTNLPSFNDLQSKAVWDFRSGHQLSLFALRSRESTDATFNGTGADSQNRIGLIDASNNDVVSFSFSSPWGQHTTLRTIAAWYHYRDALGVDGSIRNDASRSNTSGDDAFTQSAIVFTRALGVRDLSLRQEVNVAATARQTVSTGIEAHALRTEWDWTITGNRNSAAANGSSVRGGTGLPDVLNSAADSSRIGAWLEDDVRVSNPVRIAGGVRLDWSRLAQETTVAPRVRATVDVSPRTRLRIATGLFTQSPGYEKLLQSDYFVDLSSMPAGGLKSERAVHWIGGLERDLGEVMTARVEAYYKTFDRMIDGRIETPAETAARVAQYAFPVTLSSSVPGAPQITSLPENGGAGRSYGFDLYVEKRQARAEDSLSGWIAYTWGRASREIYGVTYPFDYDRRHSLSVVSTWRMTPKFSLGATLRIASGFPFTPPVGVRVDSMLAPGAVSGAAGSLVPRIDSNGQYVWTVDYGGISNLNSGRMPMYARLDLRLTYMPSPSSRWQLYVEVINASNRKNASTLRPELRYDPGSDRPTVTLSGEGSLPRLPSVGLRWRF